MAFALNPRQLEAATLADRHVLVTAGAGTGKTRTVVGRILYLLGIEVEGRTIAEPVPLSRIAAITYTNAAAADLIRKLREGLRVAGRRDLAWEVDTARVGTIHRFCGEILGEFALRSAAHPVPTILEEGEGRALADEAARDALIAALEEGAVPDLEDVVARHDGDRVVGYVLELLDRSDVIRRLRARDAIGGEEAVVLALAGGALDLLEERLHDLGAVDFDRMITWTRDLLRNDEYARATLRRRIHTLIVDEYQDVDPVQREIAYLLGDIEHRSGGTRLMLVGDPKQSIYRFRHADVTGWREVERTFEEGAGALVTLEENYRSTEQILAFADATVGRILDAPINGEAWQDYEVPFTPLTMGKPDEQAGGDPVELVVVPAGDEKSGVDERRLAEAAWIAARARELNQAGTAWKDMAVLVPAWSAADAIEAALQAAGAPTYVMRDEGFLDRREIVDLIVALEAAWNPYDDRALLGFLRSPFVGVKDETLFAIADAVGTPYWTRLPTVETPEPELLARGVTLLHRLVALRDRVTVDELLTELLDATGYLAHLALLGDARDQAVVNVRKFVRMARGRRQMGTGDFLRDIRAMRDRGDRVPDAPLHGEGEDVLTITSVHGAKGLEWEVVFWCDVGRQPPNPNARILVGRDRVTLKDPEADKDDQPQAWKDAVAQDGLESSAERKRLWYVAATRAKRKLVVSGFADEKTVKGSAEEALEKLLDGVPATEGLPLPFTTRGGRVFQAVVRLTAAPGEAVAKEVPLAPLGSLDALAGPREAIPVLLGRPRHSATSFLQHVRCERRHGFKYVMGVREPQVDRTGEQFIGAIARGQIVHDVLEQLREDDELDLLLEDAIGRWDADAPPPDSAPGTRYRAHLRDEVTRVANHPEYRAIADAPDAARELAFLQVTPSGDVFTGAIDLAAPEGDGVVLLDVKTNQGDEATARRKAREYEPQRDVYVSAAEAISGRGVGRFAFQFSRAEVQVSQPIDDALRGAMSAHVRDRLQRIGQGTPPVTRHAGECWFCGYKKVGLCEGASEETVDDGRGR
jgi:ATP-dependent helicase/nuclease subunit A